MTYPDLTPVGPRYDPYQSVMVTPPGTMTPRLFVGGPWHGRVIMVPDDRWEYRVAVPGETFVSIVYVRRVWGYADGHRKALTVFVPSAPTEPPTSRVIDALAVAAGLSPMET